MSNSEDSTVTYTVVSSPFGGLSDIRSLGVDGPPVMLEDPYAYMVAAFQAPPSPDYVPYPKEPEQAPLSPEFVPEPVYLEFMPPEDEVFPTEEQPLPANVSPTADSLGYITDSNPEEDEEDPEEDPIDYPTDGRDDDDDDDELSDYDEDDDVDVEEDKDEEEEEEHPASADSVPPPVHRVTARMSIRDEPPTPFWSCNPSPPTTASSPVLVSPPPLPASPTYLLGFRAAMIWQRVESPSTSHSLPLPLPIILSHIMAYVAMIRAAEPSTYILAPRSETPPSDTPLSGTPPLLPIPLPTPSPHMLFSSTVYRVGVAEVTLPPWKRLCIALGMRYKVGKSSSAPTARPTRGFRSDYYFVATFDDEIRRDPERYIDFFTTVRHDTDEIYVRVDDAQDDRSLMSVRLNMLFRDRRAHARTALLMEREARLSYGDCSLVSSRLRSTSTTCGDTKTDEYTANTGDCTAGTSLNAMNSNNSGTCVRRQALPAHECTYLEFLPILYPVFDTLLPFLSENEDKVFNPGILISNEEKSPHLLSHRDFKVF
ncbi:hypothetical protein Tco_0115518 [Tanacetum coccineum]